METVGKILVHVSGQLSDQQRYREFSRWTRFVTLEYLNQGLKEIAAYRPDAFSKDVSVPLVAGAEQKLDTTGTISAITANGATLNKTDVSLYRAFAAYATCPPTVRVRKGRVVYKIRSIAVDEDNKGIFYVSPPVPDGLDIQVSAHIVGEPPEYTLADWDKPIDMQAKYLNNLIDYMMARAYKRDSESQVSEQKSQRLFSLFYSAMGQKYKIDSAYSSGYYKGAVGSGDPRAALT